MKLESVLNNSCDESLFRRAIQKIKDFPFYILDRIFLTETESRQITYGLTNFLYSQNKKKEEDSKKL